MLILKVYVRTLQHHFPSPTSYYSFASLSHQSQHLSREDQIRDYFNKDIPNGKYAICRFYHRGCCNFDAKDCKFAHGPEDLKFEKLDPNEFEEQLKLKSSPKEEASSKEEYLYHTRRERQPHIPLGRKFKNLYEYQFVLKRQGKTEKIYTLDEVNGDLTIRQDIRRQFYCDLQQGLMDFLFQQYNTTALNKVFIEKCFSTMYWIPEWKYILGSNYAYETKSSTLGTMIVKQPEGKLFDECMEDWIIRIIKDFTLIDQLPISPSIITRLYYKHLGSVYPLLPSHTVYLKNRGYELFDDYLNEVQMSDRFLRKLADSCAKPITELSELIIFNQREKEIQDLVAGIQEALTSMIEDSYIGLVQFSKFEDIVMDKCARQLKLFSNNNLHLRSLMTKVMNDQGVLVMNLGPDVYVFCPDKLKNADLSELKKDYYSKLHNICYLKPSEYLGVRQKDEIIFTAEEFKLEDRKTKDFLDKEIDLRKVLVVDDDKTFEIARKKLGDSLTIGIDIEGNLKKGGWLDLVQCSSKDDIIIFDIQKVKTLTAYREEGLSLYKEMTSFIKKLMEDPSICKVFHDCRKDSLALHEVLATCPTNVFDLSAVHMLIEHLEKYFSMKNDKSSQEGQCEEDDLKKNAEIDMKALFKRKNRCKAEDTCISIEDIKMPSLNDVLEQYQASHGLNNLKPTMRTRFIALPRQYFLQRPLDRELLVYSAKDVEDLVEVKEKMERRLKGALENFIGKIEEEKMIMLWKKVSKTYRVEGCKEFRGEK